MNERKRRRMVGGAILIAAGLFGLLANRLEDIGPGLVLGAIGVGFLIAYLASRQYGFLVPAGILMGMSGGHLMEAAWPDMGRSILLGMGLGFFLVWLLHWAYRRENVWWPVFPGTVLVLLGLPLARNAVELLFDHWPVLVILVGAALLAAAFFGRGGDDPASAAPAGDPAPGAPSDAPPSAPPATAGGPEER